MHGFMKQVWFVVVLSVLSSAWPVVAQEVPTDYQGVLKTLDKKGDFKAGVLKINIPRSDLKMTVRDSLCRRLSVSVDGSH